MKAAQADRDCRQSQQEFRAKCKGGNTMEKRLRVFVFNCVFFFGSPKSFGC